MTDFERAAVNAFRVIFLIQINKVSFLFLTIFFLSIQSNGLPKLYESDVEFALKISGLMQFT